MLPVIVIGADPEVQSYLETIPGTEFHPTVEEAVYRMRDEGVSCDDSGRWPIHVAYGPDAFGKITSGQRDELTPAGWVFVVDTGLTDNPRAARRVVAGTVTGGDTKTLAFEAFTMLRANFVVDAADPNALAYMITRLHDPVEIVGGPGDAAEQGTPETP